MQQYVTVKYISLGSMNIRKVTDCKSLSFVMIQLEMKEKGNYKNCRNKILKSQKELNKID